MPLHLVSKLFAIRNGGSLLDVKLVWEGGKAEFYELASFHQELTEEPVQSSKGEEPAPVLEVPEFTGGVNAVEALVHELPGVHRRISNSRGMAAQQRNLSSRVVSMQRKP